ncbi:MAG: glycosyltransferase [Kiritimatiellae bacterium]|nr:glycosyltransferase [Kiritimatiellia bacterium]
MSERTDLDVALFMENLKNQKLDQNALKERSKFRCCMMTTGFEVRGRHFRFGISRLIRETRPEVIISYEASPVTMFLCLLRRFSKWRLWTSMDEAAVTIRNRRGIRAWVRNAVLRCCDGVMVPSEESAQALKELRPGLSTAVVPIIHDTKSMRAEEASVVKAGQEWRNGLPPSWRKVMLFVGRLAPVKNLQWLLERMTGLPGDVGLVLVGDGPMRDELAGTVQKLGLSGRVLFDGKVEGNEVYKRMSASDLLVLPSVFEPYGAVVGEALQWGTPVLVSEQVGAKALVDGTNGVVFDSGDAAGFNAKVERALGIHSNGASLLPVSLEEAVEDLTEALLK